MHPRTKVKVTVHVKMLLIPVPEKFNTFNTFTTFNTFDCVSNSNCRSCDSPPGTPNDHARTDGHGSHQDGDCLRRQRPACQMTTKATAGASRITT
jgi:hypothetical protein